MKLKLKIPADFLISAEDAAEAGTLGISECVMEHLRERNKHTTRRPGFRKTNYWAEAADSVTTTFNGRTGTVSIDKEGVSLHYHGGTVKPKKKALAIPISPLVQDIWPSELGGALDLIWPKSSSHGFLKDPVTSELLYLLVSKAEFAPDSSVLPTDDQMLKAAEEAIWEAVG